MICEYARDDGAYVLGSLAPAERSAFERHMSGCQPCRNAVSELAVLPGLLGRLDAATAERVAAEADAVESSRLPRLLSAAAERRVRDERRRRWRTASAAAAAACLVLLIGIGAAAAPSWLGRESVTMSAMDPVGNPGPFSAEVGLVEVHGGTLVRMHCTYRAVGGDYHAWVYRLVAFDRDGRSEQVGSWIAGPGDDLSFDWVTHQPSADLARLELQKEDGSPLLTWIPT